MYQVLGLEKMSSCCLMLALIGTDFSVNHASSAPPGGSRSRSWISSLPTLSISSWARGASPATLYANFGNKDGLIAAALERRLVEWTEVWDAAIAAASVAAQLLMAQRRIENWWLWIAVDLASIPLYLAKGLYLFAGLYLIYLALAVAGLISWLAVMRRTLRLV